jgi:hypothetical protein
MKAFFKHRPSPAMVVSLIALVVASSGTAMAAATLMNGDKLIKKGSLSGNRLRSRTITGNQVNLRRLGKVPTAGHADLATNATNASRATNATNASHAADAALFNGNPISAFVGTCNTGAVAVAAAWYAPQLQPDPTYVAPNRYGGEGGFACNGGTPLMTKESTGFYRLKVSPALSTNHQYIAYINPDGRGSTPLYGDANSELSASGTLVWDVHVFDKNGNPVDPYYMDVLLVAVS